MFFHGLALNNIIVKIDVYEVVKVVVKISLMRVIKVAGCGVRHSYSTLSYSLQL